LKKLVNKVISTEVKENDIAEFIPAVMAEFRDLSKEEVIKKFVSTEFNQFIEYYNRAGDLNRKQGRDSHHRNDRISDRRDRANIRDRRQDRDRSSRKQDENKTRFFVNLGQRDGLNPGGLLRVVCDAAGLNSSKVGRIDILASFSFFEADNDLADKIIKEVNGVEYEGHKVSVEVTKKRSSNESRGGGGHRGGRRRSSFGGGKGRRDGSYGSGGNTNNGDRRRRS
jgi:ATP-dependent RNA helicase DeaD